MKPKVLFSSLVVVKFNVEVMQRNILQEMYMTHVDGVFDADTFFGNFQNLSGIVKQC